MRNAFIVDTGVHIAADSGFNFTVKCNCSISPRDLFSLFGASPARREFNPGWMRLAERRIGTRCRSALRSRGNEFEIGRHLDSDRRQSLAVRLRHGLSNHPLARESTRTQ